MATPRTAPSEEPAEGAWLVAFHAGERSCLSECYQRHFALVERAVGTILKGTDRENVIHEVFYRLIGDADLRRSFRGGNFPGWLRVVARHEAIDYARKRRPEVPLSDDDEGGGKEGAWIEGRAEARADARLTLERFRARVLPAKWESVFIARFVDQHDQPTAARLLGLGRTTLAYREYRIRSLLETFVRQGEP